MQPVAMENVGLLSSHSPPISTPPHPTHTQPHHGRPPPHSLSLSDRRPNLRPVLSARTSPALQSPHPLSSRSRSDTADRVDRQRSTANSATTVVMDSSNFDFTLGRELEDDVVDVEEVEEVELGDNASSNATAIEYLKRKTMDWKRIVLEHEYIHMRCCAHILNLIVVEGLKDTSKSILCVRDVVRYVRSSPQRMETFNKCVEKEKIKSKQTVCLDVCTRWNSTYLMLEVAIKFEKAFQRMGEEDSSFIKFFGIKEGDEDFSLKLEGQGGSHMISVPTPR
ncbi:uncharacterized protein LOC131302895 [Rhododendron vialii]|uniref:uncharacterized protein LOC131302895 n=1 Tax=Rhododendron vialii TaxID=182163 RepID=UPI00265E3F0F|nr:uncharacterized protein LOC131302895 [Rhododendron vialii]